jgi:molybdopterin/thiamine biosynthesis adenylyltransferase
MDKLVPPPRFKEELQRTVSAWGEKVQSRLARLRIGIVGLGSVGSIIAEALARTGIQSLVLIDFDIVERANLDRILHATKRDSALGRFKVETIARAIRKSATGDGFTVLPVPYSVAEEEGFRAALDCDVLFCCVDRPLGRSVLVTGAWKTAPRSDLEKPTGVPMSPLPAGGASNVLSSTIPA